MSIVKDPFYRYYNCFIQCPRIKCEELEAKRITQQGEYSPSGITVYNGWFPVSSTFTFTTVEIPLLANSTCNGELTLYLNDNAGGIANVSLIYVIKVNGTISSSASLVAQRYGNMNDVSLSVSGNTVIISVSPATECRWMYRGV